MRFLLFPTAVLHVLLTGCADLSYSTYSVVEGSNHVVLQKSSYSQYGVLQPESLGFADFTLSIRPTNWQTHVSFIGPFLPLIPIPGGVHANASEKYSAYEQHDFFLVNLSFKPKGQELSFDPFAVILRTSNKDGIKPTGFWGREPYSYYDGCAGYIDNREPPQVFNSGLVPIRFSSERCFTLLFEIKPPSPEHPFVFELIGLSKGAQAISVTPIPFVKQSGWNYSTSVLQ